MSKNITRDEPPSIGGKPEEDDPGGANLHEYPEENLNNNVSGIKKFRNKVLRILRFGKSTLEEEVTELIEEHDPEGTQVGSEERNILSNLLNLGDQRVEDVMIPRSDIIAVDNNITLDEIKKVIADKEHTRMPVYNESLDNVKGFVHIKDLLPLLGTSDVFSVNKIMRKILYVPESMKVLDLLVKMRTKRVHMALVLDEYGGTEGLVTLEDLVEEIIGEIEDEHDEIIDTEIVQVDKNTLEVNARVSIDELEEKLNVKLSIDNDDDDFDTIGGLIFVMLGRVPEIGETVKHECGYIFEITDADPRKIKKILLRKG